jgi:hypothetical protein
MAQSFQVLDGSAGGLVSLALGGNGSASAAEPSSADGPAPEYTWQVGVAPTYMSGQFWTHIRPTFSTCRFL